jgi:DNA-binding SARP family transcriptional activator
VDALIRAGAYDDLEPILRARRAAWERDGDSARVAVCDAVEQLCLACAQLHHEQEDHIQAMHRVAHLEDETRLRIERLLEPLWVAQTAKPDTATPPAVDYDGVGPSPTWWKSLRQWMARAFAPPQAPAPQPDATVADTPTTGPAPGYDATPTAAPPAIRPTPAPAVASPVNSLPAFNIYCLGAFRVYQDDRLISSWPSRKGRSILQFFLVHRALPISKDILMETFWPEGDPADTRRNLHQAIYSLRQSLRQHQPDLQPIIFNKDTYSLNPDMIIRLDFEEFEKHSRQGQKLEAANQLDRAIEEYGVAVSFYQGDFLEEDLYEDWPTMPRDNLRNLFITVANRLGEYYWDQSEYTASIALSQVILTKDNCNEGAHRRLMRCYAAMGQRHLAIRQYLSCVQSLKVELDLAPSEETTDLYQALTG